VPFIGLARAARPLRLKKSSGLNESSQCEPSKITPPYPAAASGRIAA